MQWPVRTEGVLILIGRHQWEPEDLKAEWPRIARRRSET